MNETFDEYDFTPTSNSSLASLFDNSSEFSDSASLIYTAPKQPKTTVLEVQSDPAKSDTKIDSTVISAKVVQVWKLVNAQYAPIGKHGLAIIGSSAQSSYEIILYKDKTNIIVREKISPSLGISLKKDNFISFLDSLKNNWLVKFNNSEDEDSIISCLEKYGARSLKKEDEQIEEKNNLAQANESVDENKAKADILTRIAKMGQSMLPNKNLDIEQDLPKPEPIDSHNRSSPDEHHQISQASVVSQKNIIQPPTIANIPTTFVMNHSVPYDPLSMYFTETRCHNNEVKINLSQVSEKLNHIMKLVDPNGEPNCDVWKSKVKVLELRNENLLKETATLQEENVKLKQQIQQKNELLLEQEQNTKKLKLEKETEATQIEDVNLKIQTYEYTIAELRETIESQKNEIEQLSNNDENSKLKTHVLELENTISDLKLKYKDLESDRTESKNALNLLHEKTREKNANFTTLLKEEMNGMYASILSNFDDKQSFITEVNAIIAHNIKSTTLKIIQKFQQIYDDPI